MEIGGESFENLQSGPPPCHSLPKRRTMDLCKESYAAEESFPCTAKVDHLTTLEGLIREVDMAGVRSLFRVYVNTMNKHPWKTTIISTGKCRIFSLSCKFPHLKEQKYIDGLLPTLGTFLSLGLCPLLWLQFLLALHCREVKVMIFREQLTFM